jgi:dipeptidyl aminopeptidase/acylaminoacyl peptidase
MALSDPQFRQFAPYGTWPSPITPASLVEEAVGLAYASVEGDRIYWVESRPGEAGRQVLVSAPLDGSAPPADAVPAGFSVRTQVHEYGGRCYCVHGSTILFSNWRDQRLWISRPGTDPTPVTAEPDLPRSVRFADPVVTPEGASAICVRETHHDNGVVVNDLVAVHLGEGAVTVLAGGHDFFSYPRLSPDGTRLCWLTWELPDMPWDSSRLWCADVGAGLQVGSPHPVAGAPGESVTQPRWSADGVLHYVSDRTGWWNIYSETGVALCPAEAEFGEPDWVFGNATYGFSPDGDLVAAWSGPVGKRLGLIREGRAEPVDLPFSSFASVLPRGDGIVYAIAASPTNPPAVVRLDLAGEVSVVRRSREVEIDDAHLSRPQAVRFPTGGGHSAHALVYLPAHATVSGPPDELPPVIVIIHGGPTAAASAVFNLAIQYWTNRGFAVTDVDYRGSSGYGREYRRLLDGAWGIADVEDCAAAVAWLDREGWADGSRAVIRGGSAGGFTTLAALAFTDVFAAGASHYGVADLALLARDTHKFESRYLDRLVGPWPEAADEYDRRSPVHHVDQITSPLILFQGLEDMVVPPSQSELMYAALRDRGVPVAYMAFEGEQHGFRKAETVVAVVTAELEFYGRALAFSPPLPDDRPPLLIANEAAINKPR